MRPSVTGSLLNLAAFLEQLRDDDALASINKAAANQAIILPVLARLGWNTYNIPWLIIPLSGSF